MAINYPGPFELRLKYSVSVSSVILFHEARYNVDVSGTPTPGDTFDNIDLIVRNNPPVAADTFTDAWVALLDDLYNSGNTSFILAELWEYTPETFQASFVSTYQIGVPGTNGSSNTAAGQSIYVFRTAEGGILKLSMMEAVQSGNVSLLYDDLNAAQKAIVDWVMGDGNAFLGRDTSEPIAFSAMHPGQNEVVFKKRFRP